MKTSIIFLGLVALTVTTSNATSTFKSQDLNVQELTTITVANNQQESQSAFLNKSYSNRIIEIDMSETVIFDPSTVVNTTCKKSIEDIIAENKLITESNEDIFTPLFIETSTEDKIEEQNQIIESTITNEVVPLDFEKINRTSNCSQLNSNAAKISDIKL